MRPGEWDERAADGRSERGLGQGGDRTEAAPPAGVSGRGIPITGLARWFPGPLLLFFSKVPTYF